MIRETNDDAVAQRLGRRVRHRLPGVFIDDAKHCVERLADRLTMRPTGQRFGDGVHVRDAAIDVGRDHGIADAVQRDAQHFAPLTGAHLRVAHRLAKSDDERTREQVREEADQDSRIGETNLTSRFDEEVGAGEESENRDDDRRDVAAQPYGHGHGTEQRDERKGVAHPRVEQVAEKHRCRERGK